MGNQQLSIAIAFVSCLVISTISHGASAEFIVSAAKGCSGSHPYKPQGEKIYGYEFWGFSEDADVMVSVVSTPAADVLKMQLVTAPSEADLIIVDEYRGADMFMCVPRTGSGYKSISVMRSVTSWTDLKVMPVPEGFEADYKIYVSGDTLTLEQAISFFPAMWFLQRRKLDEALKLDTYK